MAELPTGTVTFLFTDIEGSTRLLEELGDSYADALTGHREALRKAFADHNGSEVDTQGDAFFVAFARAKDAVNAAAASQRALAGAPIRVRMGIHTGEPIRTDEGYVGMDVHRGARIASAGHGGQILISRSAGELVRDDLPDELALEDLGEHRLKDLSRPQQIFQLVGEGLERDFPALATLDNRPTNLPLQPTRLIGRERELEEVGALLRRPEVRLLTVTGPGGAGKTRLTLQAAADSLDDFGDGVFVVGLAGVAVPSLVVPAIAQALGVRETAGVAPAEALERFVRERELLLVLDNFEHLLEAAPQIQELLLKAPSLKALVSSRAPLRVLGEQEYPIPELSARDALALFSERAQAVKPDFRLNGDAPTVAEICRRLDGLPLAIELAAARAKLLSATALLGRLENRLSVLSVGARDVPDRQRTLRATIAWSCELLDGTEQRLFSRLAVFVSGFTVAAAEEVCDADFDILASLVEKSLVRQGEDRFRMLETIREYATERLQESGELEQVRRLHLEYFVEFAQHQGAEIQQSPDWLERLAPESDNLRVALLSARALDQPRLELRLAGPLADFLELRGDLTEGAQVLVAALERDLEAPAELRGQALQRAALIALRQADHETARRMATELGRLHAMTGEEVWLGRSLNYLGVIASEEQRYDEARDFLEQAKSIQERLGDELGMYASVHNMGLLSMHQGEYERARPELEISLAIAEMHGWDTRIANSMCDLGFAELGAGRLDRARERFTEAIVAALRLGWKENVAYSLAGFGRIDAEVGALDRAAMLLGQVDGLADEIHLTFSRYAERERSRLERDLRSHIAEEPLAALRAEGRSLSVEAAVAEALRPLD
ncbi:MAG: adenylate/guanylate cyclase domain-containing protein [Actinomycetota bacterium]